VSDVSQGPGWWQASDLKWYPPELVPGGASEPSHDSVWDRGALSRGSLAASAPQARLRQNTGPTSAGAVWPLLMIVCGVMMIIGSVNEWVSISLPAGLPAAISRAEPGGPSGTSSGVGWIALIGGIVLILLSMAMIVSVGALLRLLSMGAAAAAGSGLGIAIYFVDKIVSLPVDVGWGLIAVLAAGVIALAASGAVTLAAGD
jgi:hypothetical protein